MRGGGGAFGGVGGGVPPSYHFFRTPPPNQNWCPPLWKSTINNNLKSSSNPWKICLKKFIFSKFGGLQAYSRQFYHQMNSFTGIFWQYYKLPHAPPMFWLEPLPSNFEEPPHVRNTCGKSCGAIRIIKKFWWKLKYFFSTAGSEFGNKNTFAKKMRA